MGSVVRFASRVSGVKPFLVMEVLERALALERSGARVIHLEVGEPDFPPPPEAVRACQDALGEGFTRYTDSRGLPELREAIALAHERRAGVPVDPGQVLVTQGTSPAMQLVLSLLVDPGDEVILGAPYYACYPSFVCVAGGVPVLVPTRAEDGWALDVDAVRAAITPRTRAILVGSPANPTGAIQGEATMRGLAELGIPLVSDEIYDGLVYGGARVTSALGLAPHVFVIDGFSKRYAMTGFRLGYVIAPREAVRPLQSLAQNLFISASGFVQRAGIAALAHGEGLLREMLAAFARRRERLLAGVRSLGLDVPCEPAGAFYVFADARRFSRDSRALAFDLLERAHVAVTPGIDFGETGEGWLRLSYAASEAAIDEAIERMRGVLR